MLVLIARVWGSLLCQYIPYGWCEKDKYGGWFFRGSLVVEGAYATVETRSSQDWYGIYHDTVDVVMMSFFWWLVGWLLEGFPHSSNG